MKPWLSDFRLLASDICPPASAFARVKVSQGRSRGVWPRRRKVPLGLPTSDFRPANLFQPIPRGVWEGEKRSSKHCTAQSKNPKIPGSRHSKICKIARSQTTSHHIKRRGAFWSAATCRRFRTGRHVCQSESAVMSAQSKPGRDMGHCGSNALPCPCRRDAGAPRGLSPRHPGGTMAIWGCV